MSNASDYLKDELLDHITDDTGGIWVAPATLYLALLQSPSLPSDDTTTNAAKEVETPTVNGYDREIIVFGSGAASGVISSTAQITFGPAGTAWAEVTHAWVTDALTGGNILFQGALQAGKTVGAAASLVFEIGEVRFTLA